MLGYGGINRAFRSYLAGCVQLNTQTPSKHTPPDVEDQQLRPVILDMKRR
jgi:hypothetical protein